MHRRKNLQYFLNALFLLHSVLLSGQVYLKKVAISTGGQEITSSQYRMNLTVGQSAVTKIKTEGTEACLGFWYEIKSITLRPFKLEKYARVDAEVPKADNRISGLQVYPNPFAEKTEIEFELAEPGMTRLNLIDVQGKEIDLLVHGMMDKGKYKITYLPKPGFSGVYTFMLTGGKFRVHKSCIITQ